MFIAVIERVDDSSTYYQPFSTCCDLRRLRSSLGRYYRIVDIFYRGLNNE